MCWCAVKKLLNQSINRQTIRNTKASFASGKLAVSSSSTPRSTQPTNLSRECNLTASGWLLHPSLGNTAVYQTTSVHCMQTVHVWNLVIIFLLNIRVKPNKLPLYQIRANPHTTLTLNRRRRGGGGGVWPCPFPCGGRWVYFLPCLSMVDEPAPAQATILCLTRIQMQSAAVPTTNGRCRCGTCILGWPVPDDG